MLKGSTGGRVEHAVSRLCSWKFKVHAAVDGKPGKLRKMHVSGRPRAAAATE